MSFSPFYAAVASPGVDFTNDLCAVFTCTDHKSAKWESSHQCFFVHLGSAQEKAAHKTLMKLTPGLAAGEKNEVCWEKESWNNCMFLNLFVCACGCVTERGREVERKGARKSKQE